MTYKLRESGLTFAEIGRIINVSKSRASQIFAKHKRRLMRQEERNKYPPAWDDDLSVRLANIMNNMNITSRAQAIEAFKNGTLRPYTNSQGPGIRNYGWGSHVALAEWLGLPKPIKGERHCPHCGGIIK